MDKLDELVLFNIAVQLDVPEILRWCKTNKRFNDKICTRDPIWNYLLNKEFPKEKDDFLILSERNYLTPKELFKLLFSLKTLKEKLNLKDTLLELYNRKELNLVHNHLKEIPKEIELLKNLQRLDLDKNELKKIPKEIGLLKNLQYLSLYGNQLEEIPKEIGLLKNLQQLYLNYNKLKEIPREIGNLTNLNKLYLNSNQLRELPKEIGNLTNLKFLFLTSNKLTEIPKEIDNLINLDKNQLKEIKRQ